MSETKKTGAVKNNSNAKNPVKKEQNSKKESSAKKTKNSTEFEKYRNNKKKGAAPREESIEEINETIRRGELSFQETMRGRKVKDEIIIIVSFLLSLLMVLSYFDLCGIIGTMLNCILFGMMGVFAYVFPIVFFGFVLFLLANRYNSLSRSKITLCAIIIICITSIIHILSVYDNVTFFGSFAEGFKNKSGGGFAGELLAWPFCHLFGKIAAIIIEIVIIIVSFMLLTGKALLSIVGNKSKQEYKNISQKKKEFDAARAKRKYEENIARTNYNRNNYISGSDKGLYSVPVDNANKQGEFIPRKTNESFLKRLKQTGGNFEENKKPVENEASVAEAPKNEPDSGLDMIEITGLPAEAKKNDEEVYVSELKRKFGTSDEKEYINNEITKDANYDSEIFADKKKVDSSDRPFITDESDVISNQASSNFGMPANKDSSTLTKSSNPAVFARGDYKKITSSSENLSHSINGLQNQPSASPVNDATSQSFIKEKVKKIAKPYKYPPISLLKRAGAAAGSSKNENREVAKKLEDTLKSFGVDVDVDYNAISCGPSVTRYELIPKPGVKVSRITGLADDIKLNLAASDIRIEAPIPGKSAIGIEVPNKVNQIVTLGDLICSNEFRNSDKKLTFAVGKDIGGQVKIADISKMPHLLIAGATGSGKSVCINTLIVSILYKASPEDVKLILVDPKVVELSVYNGIPHLLIPVVTDPKKASGALFWAVHEMDERYQKFAKLGVRDLTGFNESIKNRKEPFVDEKGEEYTKLPQIVIVIDELADLMMVAPGEVEEHICRLAQLARAAGIHLVIATQRPTVNVITGLIKANVPSRIAFAVSSQIDSRTIIDMAGAEKLLGKGDMLFFPQGLTKPVRVQGAFVSDNEVSDIVNFVRQNNEMDYDDEIEQKMNTAASENKNSKGNGQNGLDAQSSGPSNDYDEYIYASGMFIISKEKASIGALQRQFKIGFNRAARIMDQLADFGVVGPEEGTKPRQILMTADAFEKFAVEKGLKN